METLLSAAHRPKQYNNTLLILKKSIQVSAFDNKEYIKKSKWILYSFSHLIWIKT